MLLIKAPDTWSAIVVAVVSMILLAVLDIIGAIAAKEAVAQRSALFAAVGLVSFVLLFWVYASSLQYVDLGPVTLGWVVMLQVGVLMLDRFRYGVSLPSGAWLAIALILAGQAYLLLVAPAPGAAAGG